jgi:hypothetical protein
VTTGPHESATLVALTGGPEEPILSLLKPKSLELNFLSRGNQSTKSQRSFLVRKFEPVLCRLMLCIGVAVCACGVAPAQSPHSQVRNEIRHDLSPPLRTIKPVVSHKLPIAAGRDEAAEIKERQTRGSAPTANIKDPVAQLQAGTSHPMNSGLNFDGVTAPTGRAVPDTNGAVGLTQYFQWVNVDFEIFDKTTGASIYGPVDASTIWSGFSPCNTSDQDDVVVEYDKIANVWVLEQHVAPPGGPNYQCIAVSTSSDATGNYHRYAFALPNTFFPDYPKISVWPDAYYLSIDSENPSNFAPIGSYLCALDRAAMLTGAAATSQCFQLSTVYNDTLPSDLDGTILPPAGSPNYMLGLWTNSLNLWQFHVDWVNPANTTLTGPVNIPVAAYNDGCAASSLCVPQEGTSQLVDGIGGRVLFRLAYRHFADGHESLVANHTVNNPGPVAVRWYEVQSPGNNPYVFQQGTYAPDSNNRWMGSIAMDQMGDIAVGYSVSSASMYPAVRYAARLQSDVLNTLESENSIIEGTGSEVGSNRWGDYSAMSVDPADDCTFWYTQEYFPVTGDYNWHTRVASFSFPSCTSTPPVTLSPNGLYYAPLNVGQTSAAQTVTLTNLQSVPLNIASIVPTGNYTESDNCVANSPIPANGTCTISVTFKPVASGILTGQVTVTDDAPGGFQVVNMTGTGAAPAVTLAPTSLKFSGVLAGSTSAAKAVTLTNSGFGTLTISAIVASGDYSETDNCVANSPLAQGASCTINVTFSPTVTGTVAGEITVNDNGVNGAPHRIPLSGSGTVTLAVTPASLTFASTTVGSTSAAQVVTVLNNAATAQSFSWTTGGDYAAMAGGVTPCTGTLNPASACTLSVTFSPTTNGTGGVIKGALAVSDTATGIPFNPQAVGLSGTATGGPPTNPLTFSPTSLNFSNVAIGATKTGTAQISNGSGASLTISSIAASGEYSVAGSGTTPCRSGLVLAAKAKCGFTVSLTPDSGGSIAGSVTIVDNAASGPTVQTYNLAAVGYWPITLSPASLSFPKTTVGTTSNPMQVTVTNYTTSQVTLNGFGASGDYAVVTMGSSPCQVGTVLSAAGKCTFGVTFLPTVTGTIQGAVTVSHSAPNSPQVVSLTGAGQ